MPPPDWERADRLQADQPGADRGLAHRLSRLPSSHPSAWPSSDREEWWRPAADPEPTDTEPTDTEPTDTGPNDADVGPQDCGDEPDAVPPGDDEADLEDTTGVLGGASRPAAPVRGERRSEAPPGWREFGGSAARSRYRPWFSAEGAADPWFAVHETE